MRLLVVLLCCFSVAVSVPARPSLLPNQLSQDEVKFTNHLKGEFENQATYHCNKLALAEWKYNTDLDNTDKEEALVEATLAGAQFQKDQWETWFRNSDWKNFKQADVKRQAMFLSKLGIAVLGETKLQEYNKALNSMAGVYGSARVCPFDNKNCNIETHGMRLEPDVEKVMATSRDYEELKYVWNEWHENAGKPIRADFEKYVELSNEVAQKNDYKNMGEMWQSEYETDHLLDEIKTLWEEVKPLYKQLHSYAREKLLSFYSEKMENKPEIPAFLLGNMWSQNWEYIYDILEPFPKAVKFNINQNMLDQQYTVERMFTEANKFYTSLGLLSMEDAYSSKAIVKQPANKDIVCHATAWDFCDKADFRIKMCTSVNEEDFITIHHELGHIQYFMQYKDQPITFRMGGNPAFHEAIGDVISLSASTPEYYKTIKLLPEYTSTEETSINTLLKSALTKVAFLPFSLVVDLWRWEVFSGNITKEQWNQRWWELRKQYEMISVPEIRAEEYFDPGAKFHIPGNQQYINYFIAHILQFQIHRGLCIEAKQYDPTNTKSKPLHSCNIYNSKEAGAKLRDAMKLGGSVHWTDVLETMTGERKLSAQAILEYYQPLSDWFRNQEPQRQQRADDDDEPVDQTVPIVVGAILAAVVVCALGAYFFKQYKDNQKEKLQSMHGQHATNSQQEQHD